MQFVTLNNGIQMPILGFGVYQVRDFKECEQAVLDAISAGYRSIDTAQIYGNEEAVGSAIAKCGVPRKELFITTKIWISDYGYDKAKASIETSLQKLGTDYVDLFLLHQPYNDIYGAYKALIEAQKEGKTKSIGVSNFQPDRLADICAFGGVVPQLNQIELHAFFQQKYAQEINKAYGVQVESWASFAEGKNGFFDNATLASIGSKYNKSVAQVALRFWIQKGIVVIPKSVHKDRIIQNISVFDFALSSEDMKTIEGMDTNSSIFFGHNTVEAVEMFAGRKVASQK